MEFDPVNSTNAPPSRYQLESDSEEEDYQDRPSSSGTPSERQSNTRSHLQDRVQIQFNNQESSVGNRHLIILLNQAGVTWSESNRLGNLTEDAVVSVDGVQQASISLSKDLNGPTIILVYPTVSVLSLNEIQPVFARAILETLKPKSVTLFTSYSPHLYIQSQKEKDQSYQEGIDAVGFPPLRFLLSGKGCQDLKQNFTSERAGIQDLKSCSTPNVLTALGGFFASQATFLSLPLIVLLFPESISQPHSHHHSHAFLPSSNQDPTSRPPISKVRLEDRLLRVVEKVSKICGIALDFKGPVEGVREGENRLNGFLFDKRFGKVGQQSADDAKGAKGSKRDHGDSMYL